MKAKDARGTKGNNGAKDESSNLVAASVTMETELLQRIDQRVQSLDINRSQYFRRLAKADLEKAEKPQAA